ncbi:UDP-2,4-diacetamido-2,4,6-trideoxy-beta-L-altropyranose hydrolase [Chitinophaga agrisoli]|uniref:UDP-2,4-diacetamido-2,4, 6-trideoxy-beta-L-altropyranose hydrolase n=1 Tax=Chitinophaga agrisoli TaxID=2607653 RepID=A0A5B2W1X2_9BACT|nr:UDP-2,4-diacetamido-2,4,6-trideoxy-beta-L-altropyranose hydrolase [Chitinophaga agrisoli]KAA2245345.1 UDP-2,4-diacetamido-2,4,6-trideoxy-beta-L-altropyranose hydrolase [Chitinophaga agrisoli]
MKKRVNFRADGNSSIGLGHVVRSCALAAMLRDDFECHFFIREPSPVLREQILESCQEVHILPADTDYLEEAEKLTGILTGEEIVVLDGYNFDTAYQEIIRKTGCKLVCIDDIHAYKFLADVVINHAGGMSREDYDTKPFTQLYLGTEYALLRRDFLEEAKNRSLAKDKEIFICLGGADINNDLIGILSFLEANGVKEKCNIVLGSAYRHFEELKAMLERTSLQTEVIRNASPKEMIAVMKRSACAICPPSTISYEYLSLGGVLYLKQTADNQKDVLSFFVKKGLAFDLKEFGSIDETRIQASLKAQALFFDGRSDERLRLIFERLHDRYALTVRRACADDVLLFYNWANDPEVRAAALSTAPIPRESHISWFNAKQQDENAFMYVVSWNNDEMGQVRFDTEKGKERAVIDYSIDKRYRNKGLGAAMLKMATEWFVKELGHSILLEAVVKTDNIASNRVFENLGFQFIEQRSITGALCNFYTCLINIDEV